MKDFVNDSLSQSLGQVVANKFKAQWRAKNPKADLATMPRMRVKEFDGKQYNDVRASTLNYLPLFEEAWAEVLPRHNARLEAAKKLQQIQEEDAARLNQVREAA
jgi:hypothetical protein